MRIHLGKASGYPVAVRGYVASEIIGVNRRNTDSGDNSSLWVEGII
jgi:hypothetical protein